jgi:hypothetical protein
VLACGPFSPASSTKVTREPGAQAGKAAVEHAVAVKIDLAAIAGFQETKISWISSQLYTDFRRSRKGLAAACR